ncbi:LysR family transcriptional regulator [Megasphaera sp. SW808]|uniref:LysR family transcriptional regulator n=1 Tax=Megasphaera sp. SW808 TaxID=2530045 RepID=UPI001438B1BF|nr:LysR family transcriptional regulator [Megasphaera sp. SW808]NJE35283.1 LysR family transcriptional regulator [Megasphaera sp. SW808]
MEIRLLRYFLVVANEGNITRAAEKLYITQPTLSRQMNQLEEEAGAPLFKRPMRRVELTEEGLLLKRRAEEIVALVGKTKPGIG